MIASEWARLRRASSILLISAVSIALVLSCSIGERQDSEAQNGFKSAKETLNIADPAKVCTLFTADDLQQVTGGSPAILGGAQRQIEGGAHCGWFIEGPPDETDNGFEFEAICNPRMTSGIRQLLKPLQQQPVDSDVPGVMQSVPVQASAPIPESYYVFVGRDCYLSTYGMKRVPGSGLRLLEIAFDRLAS